MYKCDFSADKRDVCLQLQMDWQMLEIHHPDLFPLPFLVPIEQPQAEDRAVEAPGPSSAAREPRTPAGQLATRVKVSQATRCKRHFYLQT